MKLAHLFGSPALTLALAVLAPAIFVWSRNWHMYSWTSLGLSFCVLLAAALFVFAFASLLDMLYFRKRERLPLWTRKLAGLLICAAIVGILFFFLSVPISELPKIYRRVLLPIGCIALVAAIVFRAGFRPLNFFMTLCLLLFFGTGLADVFQYYRSQQNTESAGSTDIVLKTKPNIYLFLLESYHSLPVMRKAYGIDTGPLGDYLRDRRFFVYDNVYSNSSWTLTSMRDLFTMKLHSAVERGNQDIDPAGRRVIGGSGSNTAYRVLKENGYHTTYLTMDHSYYFWERGFYLDETDLRLETFQMVSLSPLLDLNRRLKKYAPSENPTAKKKGGFTGALLERIQLSMKEGMQRGQPFYIGFKSGAIHTPSKGISSWKDKENWVAGGRYQEAVRRSSQELAEIVDYIISEDPQSVIILLGDHGSWRLRGIWDGVEDLSMLESRLQENGESMESLADDIFGVLMAVRMPDGASDISQGYPMSHVNLFRHLFATLNDDAEILKERQPSQSLLPGSLGFVLVKEGIIQHVSDAEPAFP